MESVFFCCQDNQPTMNTELNDVESCWSSPKQGDIQNSPQEQSLIMMEIVTLRKVSLVFNACPTKNTF